MNKFKEIPIKATICQLSTDIIDVQKKLKLKTGDGALAMLSKSLFS